MEPLSHPRPSLTAKERRLLRAYRYHSRTTGGFPLASFLGRKQVLLNWLTGIKEVCQLSAMIQSQDGNLYCVLDHPGGVRLKALVLATDGPGVVCRIPASPSLDHPRAASALIYLTPFSVTLDPA